MYFLDPSRGNRRRKLLADKVVHASHLLGEAAGKSARDLHNRATGVVSTARQRRTNETVDDQVLVERVRAALGHVVSHPGAIQVTAQDGIVALAGPVLRDEAGRLVHRIGKVRGVRDVEDLLEIRDSMDEDLARVKTAIETGTPPGDAAALH
jgi:osmotically-inducible protein OsmY